VWQDDERGSGGDSAGDGGDVADECPGEGPDGPDRQDDPAADCHPGVSLWRDPLTGDRLDENRCAEQTREQRGEHAAGRQDPARGHVECQHAERAAGEECDRASIVCSVTTSNKETVPSTSERLAVMVG